jgi:hypothetical protein
MNILGVKKMEIRCKQILGLCLILILIGGGTLVCLAQEKQPITLEEALEQVFSANPNLSLFLREQDLAEKREGLANHPIIKITTTPTEIIDGEWQKPEGSLTVTMPVAKGLDLTGGLTLEVDQSGIEVTPSGTLSLKYDVLGEGKVVEGALTVEENRRQQENSLVFQTLALLVQLREKLDDLDLAQEKYVLLEASLEAARLTPNYDDLKLKKELREQASTLVEIKEEIAQLQMELSSWLGVPQDTTYDPLVQIQPIKLDLVEDMYRDEFLGASANLRKAQASLETAQNKLFHERTTAGWSVVATGGVNLNNHWNVGVTASKQLYPRRIILEELELEVAKAEYALMATEKSLDDQLRVTLQAIKSAQKQLELQEEHLMEAQEDLDLRKRQLEAGLVTELQLQEAQLELRTKELSYAHAQLVWGQSVLKLWEQCGRDLSLIIWEIVR